MNDLVIGIGEALWNISFTESMKELAHRAKVVCFCPLSQRNIVLCPTIHQSK